MIKTAIFDLDGTLAYTLPDLLTAINAIKRNHGLAPIDEDELLRFVNYDTVTFVKKSIPDVREEDIPAIFDEYMGIYLAHMCDKTRPYDGIPDVLEQLKARGVRLFVMTNKDTVAAKGMCDRLFGETMFEGVYGPGGQWQMKAKPDPDGVYRIMKITGSSADETVFIGDSDVDVNTGRNAGVHVLGCEWGYRGRAFLEDIGAVVCSDPGELLKKINDVQ